MKIGFDNELYLKLQSENILKRMEKFGEKLYIEFGGKLFDDYHASRVLPGFQPDSKLKMLLRIKEKVEIVIVINANDIQKNKIRNDIGINYEKEVLRLIDAFNDFGLTVGSVCITHYKSIPQVDSYIDKLIDYVPDLLDKSGDLIKGMKDKNKCIEKLKEKIEENIKDEKSSENLSE